MLIGVWKEAGAACYATVTWKLPMEVFEGGIILFLLVPIL